MNDSVALATIQPRAGLITKFASRFGVEPAKLLSTLKQTAFRQKEGEVSNEQMMALLIVADQYNLNPFTKEIFAFPDKGGIVPVVSVDGWLRIMNDHPAFDGMEFEYGPAENGKPEWIACTIYRKDRAHPITIRERFKETNRPNVMPWQTHPSRMLRHKAMIQCARIAFGFSGIYDEDEAQRIVDVTPTNGAPPASRTEAIKQALKARNEPAPDPEPSAPTFAEIADAIAHASNKDGVDAARSMIHDGLPEVQRAELSKLADDRLLDFENAK